MIIEKNAEFYKNLKKNSLAQRNDFIEANPYTVKLRKLAKKSEKIREFTKERNHVEDERLNFINSMIRKRQSQIDSNLNKKYLETCKFLDQINSRTIDHRVDDNFEKDQLDDLYEAPSRYTNTKSAFSIASANSVFIPSFSKPTTAISTRLPYSNMTTPIDKIFTNQSDLSQNKCIYNLENCFSRSFNTQFEEISEISSNQGKLSQNSTSPTISSLSSYASGSSCSLFPCSLLQSYTSIIGEKNDRKVKRSQHSASILRADLKSPVEVECIAQNEYEQSEIKINHFQTNISIRRPLRQKQSLKDFEFKIRALETQVKYCKESNNKAFKTVDRNIRYGSPTLGRKIKRQIRLISDFVK